MPNPELHQTEMRSIASPANTATKTYTNEELERSPRVEVFESDERNMPVPNITRVPGHNHLDREALNPILVQTNVLGADHEKRVLSPDTSRLPFLSTKRAEDDPASSSLMRTSYLDRLIQDESVRPGRSAVFLSWVTRGEEQSSERLLPFFSPAGDGSSPIMTRRVDSWKQRKEKIVAFATVHWKTILICVIVILLIMDILD